MTQETERIDIVFMDGDTRVMSPTQLSTNALPSMTTMTMMPNQGVLDGWNSTCQHCQGEAFEPALCAECGDFGHVQCLKIEMFQGYPFCGPCFGKVTYQYVTLQDAVRREQWSRSLAGQITAWRSNAIETMGKSAALGIAMGGAAATTAGAALALARGVVQGAQSAAADSRAQ